MLYSILSSSPLSNPLKQCSIFFTEPSSVWILQGYQGCHTSTEISGWDRHTQREKKRGRRGWERICGYYTSMEIGGGQTDTHTHTHTHTHRKERERGEGLSHRKTERHKHKNRHTHKHACTHTRLLTLFWWKAFLAWSEKQTSFSLQPEEGDRQYLKL